MSAYPFLGKGRAQIAKQKLTMALSFTTEEKHYTWNRIGSRHLIDTGRRLGLGSSVESLRSKMVDKLPGALERASAALPADFPTTVSQPILEGAYRQYRHVVVG